MISQELFDETVLENEDVFDLSPTEAVQETLEQLQQQYQQVQTLDLNHISKTHPDSVEGQKDRQTQQAFVTALTQTPTEADNLSRLWDMLNTANSNVKPVLCHLFWQHNGLQNWATQPPVESSEDWKVVLSILLMVLSAAAGEGFRSRQEQVLDFLLQMKWLDVYTTLLKQHAEETSTCTLWMRLVTLVCKQHESNKKKLVSQTHKTLFPALMETLDTLTANSNDFHPKSQRWEWAQATCQFIYSLCRFDDFSQQEQQQANQQSSAGMVVSSAHSNVTEFAKQYGAVGKLHALLKAAAAADATTRQEGASDMMLPCLVAIVLAVRALAITDEIVQTLVAMKLLDTARELFQIHANCENNSKASLQLVTALVGLYRNLSANDGIKTTLCRSSNESIVEALLSVMEVHSADATLQEHACATLGSMALRQPSNVAYLMERNAHQSILAAMQRHSQQPRVLRQGALAIRNFASRCENPAQRQQLLEDSEHTLKTIAGQNSYSVEEAFAALRDLGVDCQLSRVDAATGKVQHGPTMFGEKPITNFRPVYDD